MSKVAELYGLPTLANPPKGWAKIAAEQHCPYLARKCLKNRKSEPEQTIGSCSVAYGGGNVIICPHRLLERRQIFTDCLHLLTLRQPGDELHVVPELKIPGGNIDYCLVAVRDKVVVDFTGIELQTMDTTGTVWPERQRFLKEHGVATRDTDVDSSRPFGMNWKMTAKTILVQLHHKISTFQHVGKHLVLVVQDHLIDYMRKAFNFDHLVPAVIGSPMHFHPYELVKSKTEYRLKLKERWSTDRDGIATCLGLQGEANVELADLVRQISGKLNKKTLMALDEITPFPVADKQVAE